MNKVGVFIGIIGGIGLGILLGSEFSGRYMTLAGAILVVIALLSLVFLSKKKR
jgi:predicted MFS family arabinose efflux permease